MNIDIERYYTLSLNDRVSGIASAANGMGKHLNEALCGRDFYFKVDIDFIREQLNEIEAEFEMFRRVDEAMSVELKKQKNN